MDRIPFGAALRKTTTVVCSCGKLPNTYGAIESAFLVKL